MKKQLEKKPKKTPAHKTSKTTSSRVASKKAAVRASRRTQALSQSESYFDLLIENVSDIVTIINDKGDILFENSSLERVLGYRPAELMGRNVLAFIHPDDLHRVASAFAGIAENVEEPFIESRFRHKNGSWRVMSAAIKFAKDPSGGLIIVITSRDMTERKLMENELRESRELYRTLVETADDAIILTDLQGRHLFRNHAYYTSLGFDVGENVDLDGFARVHPDDIPFIRASMDELFKKGESSGEYRVQHKDGHWMYRYNKGKLIRDAEGRPQRILSIIRDITERKQAEEKMRESERRFASAFEYAAIGMALVSPDGFFLKVNRALCDLIGYSENELLAKTFQVITHPDDLETDLEYVRKMLAGEIRSYQMEKRYFHKMGRLVWVLLIVSLVCDDQGKPLYFISQIEDVTERKQAEEALRLQSIIAAEVSEAIFMTRMNDDILVYANRKAEEMFGYDQGELIGRHVSILNGEADGNRPNSIAEEITESTRRDGLWKGEIFNARKDGSFFWTYASISSYEHSEYGRVLISIQMDITERKHAEDALRESEARYRELIDSISEPFFAMDADLHYIHWNAAAEKLFHLPVEQALGKTMYEAFPGKWVQKAAEVYLEVMRTREKKVISDEFFMDEKKYSSEITIYPFQNGVSAFFKDVTERKQTEEALRQSNERFQQVAESASEWIWEMDQNGMYTYASAGIKQILGYSPEELVGKVCFYDLFDPQIRESLKREALNVFAQKGSFKNFINANRHKDGREVVLSTNGAPVLDEQGNLLGYRGMDTDITWRIHAEKKLRESEAKYRALFDSLDAAVLIMRGAECVECNGAALKLFGLSSSDQLIGKNPLDFAPSIQPNGSASEEMMRRNMETTLSQGTHLFEWQSIHSSGKPFWMEARLSPFQLEQETLFQCIAWDITVRKQAEEKLRENEALNRAVLNNSPIGISVRNPSGQLLYANDAWKKIWAVSEPDFAEDLACERKTLVFDNRDNYLQPYIEDVRKIYEEGGQLALPEMKTSSPRSGAAEWISQYFYALRDDNGFVERVVILTEDITERKQAEEKLKEVNKNLEEQLGQIKILKDYLREQATRDALTGLYNRRYLDETMEREIARARRETYPISIMIIDVDRFKTFNDSYGHKLGDQVLTALSALLHDNTRVGDMVCRYGGDEFIIVMPGASVDDATHRAETIRQKFNAALIQYAAMEIAATVSIGISAYPQHGDDGDAIFRAADFALYKAKESGRNRIVIWTTD